MGSKAPSIEPVQMGQDFAPINSTVPSLASGAERAVLTVATAQTITLSTGAGSIEFIPSVSPTGAIFIKWGTLAGQTTASATVFDEVITATKPAIQVGITTFCTTYSIFSGTSQTVYTIER